MHLIERLSLVSGCDKLEREQESVWYARTLARRWLRSELWRETQSAKYGLSRDQQGAGYIRVVHGILDDLKGFRQIGGRGGSYGKREMTIFGDKGPRVM